MFLNSQEQLDWILPSLNLCDENSFNGITFQKVGRFIGMLETNFPTQAEGNNLWFARVN